MNKKKLFSALIFLFFSHLFSQEILNNLNTSWSNVLSGTVITEPVITSYGFCVVTDARSICAFSNDGKLIWEKNTGRARNVYIKALPDDFILYSDNSNNEIKLLSPSGSEIWTKKLNKSIFSLPFEGRDGRFFLRGEKYIECYGINGLLKWNLETDLQKKIDLQELPDGSIVVFISENKSDSSTKGLRISPYGEILEEITFAGVVVNAYTCNDGILLNFKDGAAGLFSLTDNLSENKWVVPKKNNNAFFLVSENKKEFVFLESLPDGIVINELDKKNGSITHSVKHNEIKGSKLKKAVFDEYGILLLDDTYAALYSLSGQLIWYAKLSDNRTDAKYTIYTKNNHLIFCLKNWTLNAYRIIQSDLNKKNREETKDYSFYLDLNKSFDSQYATKFSDNLIDEQRIVQLKTGNYKRNEYIWQNEIISICNDYSKDLTTSDFGTRKDKTIFETDSSSFELILNQLMLFGNQNTQNLAASILSKTKNKSFQKALLIGIKNNGYDPDENLLKSLEKLAYNTSYKDKVIINYICDAVYSICFFMGRPAYNSRGKDILKNFLYPSYDSKNRDYARETLKKIIDLEL